MSELTIDQALQKAIAAHKARQVQEADRLYTAILKAQPLHPHANHNMGVLAVGVGKVEQALPFFKTALEANPAIGQFWLSYIDALIKLEQLADAKSLLDQARSKGANGDGFDKLEQQLHKAAREPLEASKTPVEAQLKQPNILDTLKLDQAIKLAKKKAKEGSPEKAKRIYQEILTKFPKNKKASDGIKGLVGKPVGKASKVQDVPRGELQSLINLYNKGQLALVVEHAQGLTKRYPKAFAVWNLLGVAAAQIGQLDQTIFAFNKVLAIKPDYAEAYNNMGNALKEQGKLEEAIEAYSKALTIHFDYAEAHNNLGVSLKEQGKLAEAVKAYNKALTIKPDYAEAYNNMGNALKEQGKQKEAIDFYNKALAIKSDYAEAYNNAGNALREQSKQKEAIECYNKALAIKPNYAEAYINMSVALKEQDRLEEAITVCNRALVIKPDYPEAYNNMGNAFEAQGKLEEAIESFNKALAIKSDYPEAYNNMGNVLKTQGKLEKAIDFYNKALAIKPGYAEAHHGLSFALLNKGRLKEGLEEYEWRWETDSGLKTRRSFSQPLWNGQDSLAGKRILVWCEQGVGDTINWVSRLSLISSHAAECILECPEKLVKLLARSFPDIEVKPEDRRNDANRDDFDYHLPLGSLYRHVIPNILKDTKPPTFLLPDPNRLEFWKRRLKSLGEGPYVGVSWKSAYITPGRRPNYASIAEWSPIFTIPGVKFINLQYVDFVDDLADIENQFGVTVHNFDDLDHYNDLNDVAALCAALDVVVSTKITVPLISAGVGTHTKLANWKQSSWSNILLNPVGPQVDIFEKNTSEPWSTVFSEIASEIKSLKSESC